MSIQKKKNAQVSKVSIGIKGIKGGRNLISKQAVKNLFRNHLGYDLESSNIRDLDLRQMETMLEEDDRVKEAEVFIDKMDRLYIAIQQRVPIVRVFSKEQNSFYLDSDGYEIPAYKGSTIRVPVASGAIENYNPKYLEEKSTNSLKDVYKVAKYIHEDEFLAALIEQIDVDENGDIIMIPKIGRQKLVFGDATELEARFDKMKLLYKEGLPNLGWRKYDVLTLNYDGQIVGKLRDKK